MHDIISVGLPILAIMAGVFFNNRDLSRLETRIDGRLDRIEGRLDRMQADLSLFYRTLGQQ